MVNYPLRGGKLMNMIGTIERNDWQVESWYTQGSIEECANDFAGWHEDVQTLIRAAPTVMKWAFMERTPRQKWSEGRSTLLGDACHATLPFLAQGAVMSIEDGVVLGRCLDQYDDPKEALLRYEAARRPHEPHGARGQGKHRPLPRNRAGDRGRRGEVHGKRMEPRSDQRPLRLALSLRRSDRRDLSMTEAAASAAVRLPTFWRACGCSI
jgi:2-polyprenyl-6-methoxyphenol hydroxylase-like FAD-dependent oxidoreductase